MLKINVLSTITFTLFFCLLSFNNVLAQDDPKISEQCYPALKTVIPLYPSPSDEEVETICQYVSEVYEGTSPACEPPTDLRTEVVNNDVELNWSPVSNAIYYIVGYLEITSGATQTAQTDLTQYLFANLPDGVYLFSVKSVCEDGVISDPIFAADIIIGDIAVISPPPNNDCECGPQTLLHNGSMSNNDLVLSWQKPCKNSKYYLSVNAHHTITGNDIDVEISPVVSASGITLHTCSYNTPPLVITSTQVTVRDLTDPILTIYFSTVGIVLTNQHPDYTFNVNYSKCCLDTKEEEDQRPRQQLGDFNRPTLDQSNSLTLSSQPNPFNQELELNYTLPKDSDAIITLYSTSGKAMKIIAQYSNQLAGDYSIYADMSAIPNGIFFLELQTAEQRLIKKLIKAQ